MLTSKKQLQYGMTLIELMIAILIGLIMTAAAITLYVNYLKNTRDNVALIKLNQDMRGVMDIMVRDVRRAGFVTTDPETNFTCLQQNAFGNINIRDSGSSTVVANGNPGSCLLYAYNRNNNIPAGLTCNANAFLVAEDTDRFGFRLSADNAIQMKSSGDLASASNCGSGNWETITEPDVTYDVDFVMTESELDMTQMFSDGVQVCNAGDDCNVCESGNQCLTIREVLITLEGSLPDGTSQEIQERVRIRNDKYEDSHP